MMKTPARALFRMEDNMNIFIRIIIALVVVLCLFAIIPLILPLLSIPNAGALATILKICIGGAALIYIVTAWPINRP